MAPPRRPRRERKDLIVATRRRRESVLEEVGRRKFDPSIWTNIGLFFLFGVAISFLSFFGLNPAGPALLEGQVARIRIVSEIDFSYPSEIKTERRREAELLRAPPVYRIEMAPYEAFRDYFESLALSLTEYAGIPEGADRERYALRPDEVERFFRDYDKGNPYNLRASDLAVIFNQLPREKRENVLREALFILENLQRSGIYSEDRAGAMRGNRLNLYQIENDVGEIEEVQLTPQEEALRNLRINLAALDVPRESSIALNRLLRQGLVDNLVFDEARTAVLGREFVAEVEPVIEEIKAGESIIEPNSHLTPLDIERLNAYRTNLAESRQDNFGFDQAFIERLVITLVVLSCTLMYLKMTGVRITPNRRTILLAGTTLLLNLFINRLLLEVGESGTAQRNPALLSILPYLLPLALAPMLIAMLIGAGAGIVCAGLLAIINSLMQGNSIVVFVSTFAVALVGISLIRRLQVRARVVRAGLFSGLMFALAALLIGLRDAIDPITVIYQMLTATGIGVLTGVALIGLLPLWEGIFDTTTDITLLELTDFNHPLLRRLQIEAPGSYHHSLMVANLSENAAAAVGANPLVCRVCALFHDIGKMVKPEYFTENQRDGYNPHIERNPSMSALVIKSHVKEGVVLAKEYKLPAVIVDVIRQHHGTSLIQYFYYKALERKRQAEEEVENPWLNAPRVELDKVNEDTYRYEGPRPHFVESAIIMLADSVEAAGRSLRKVTPQSIDDLIANIFRARVEDGQLDLCPLTFKELSRIRESFSFTLLNMLHARVEYPKEADVEAAKKRAKSKSTRAPFAELGARLGEPPKAEEPEDKTKASPAPESPKEDAAPR